MQAHGSPEADRPVRSLGRRGEQAQPAPRGVSLDPQRKDHLTEFVEGRYAMSPEGAAKAVQQMTFLDMAWFDFDMSRRARELFTSDYDPCARW